jgi:hypothetical protein
MKELTETQVRAYFESLNTELGTPNQNSECACLCPIHGEEHSSASFNLNKGVWKCYPCDLGGDLYKMEGCLFPDDPFPTIKERVDGICNGAVRTDGLETPSPKKELKNKKWRPYVEEAHYPYMAVVNSDTDDTATVKIKYVITRIRYTDEQGGKRFVAWYRVDQASPKIWHFPDNFPKILYRLPELMKAQVVLLLSFPLLSFCWFPSRT